VAHRDRVLDVSGELVNIARGAELERLAAAREIVGDEARRGIEIRVGDPEAELLVEARLFDLGADLEVVPAGDDSGTGLGVVLPRSIW
jgi:hypothetical protein